ncbi:MAG: YDG domain-containing protein, partial [Janthinobacterium sp.]
GLTASITPASLLVSVSAAAKVYDGLTDATVTFADNRIAGDVLAINRGSAHFSDKNVANGKTVTVGGIGISGTGAANYIVNTTA